jgi:hypothetical protein
MEFKKLKVGEKLSETQFYSVKAIEKDGAILTTDGGEDIKVGIEYANCCLVSANQFEKTEKVTKTELANIFIANSNVAITVDFNKQVKETDVVKEIITAYESSTPKEVEAAVKKAVKKGMSGEERTMVGRHHGAVDEFGRIHFTDMEIERDTTKKDYDNRHRLVDPRTINFLIVKGVKYILK